MRALASALAELDAGLAAEAASGLPRIAELEDEYRRVVIKAELDWVTAVAADLRKGRMKWSPEALSALADAELSTLPPAEATEPSSAGDRHCRSETQGPVRLPWCRGSPCSRPLTRICCLRGERRRLCRGQPGEIDACGARRGARGL